MCVSQVSSRLDVNNMSYLLVEIVLSVSCCQLLLEMMGRYYVHFIVMVMSSVICDDDADVV